MSTVPSLPTDTDALRATAESIFPGRSSGSYAVPPWMQDVVVASGAGSRFYTTTGDGYLDYILGSGPLILGHAHPRVVAAVQEQAGRGSTFYALNEPIIRLGQTIVDAVPCAEQVMFASTGAEATYLALRLARAATGRELILRFAGSYHGHHDYVSTQSAGVPRGGQGDGADARRSTTWPRSRRSWRRTPVRSRPSSSSRCTASSGPRRASSRTSPG